MGIDTSPENGWIRNHGLRILGGGMRLELPWPDLQTFPSYGLVRPRQDFDEILARTAQKAGAQLHENTTVTEPIRDERTGRVEGVPHARTAQIASARRSSLVADGNSSRFSLALGLRKRDDRPMGVAYRTLLPLARATTTTGWSRGSSCGTASPARAGCCPATAGSSASATAPATSGSASSTPPTRSARPTTATMLDRWLRAPAGGVGLRRGERDRPDPRRRAADGLQPQAALRRRRAARR